MAYVSSYFADIPCESLSKAYRKLALRLHPNKGGATENFKNLSASYEQAKKRCDQSPPNSASSRSPSSFKPTGASASARYPQHPSHPSYPSYPSYPAHPKHTTRSTRSFAHTFSWSRYGPYKSMKEQYAAYSPDNFAFLFGSTCKCFKRKCTCRSSRSTQPPKPASKTTTRSPLKRSGSVPRHSGLSAAAAASVARAKQRRGAYGLFGHNRNNLV